jgi:glycosyltransferase involved in cell wall biosynthesis
MKIAQIAPPFHPVPPPRYGGTERVISVLTEGLVRAGHQVTLFACADSRTAARLETPLGAENFFADYGYDSLISALHAARAFRICELEGFDLIHNHDHTYGLALANFVNLPSVTTLHVPPVDFIREGMRTFAENHYVTVSNAQRRQCPPLGSITTIHNAIELAHFPFQSQKSDYVVFLGSIRPNKGVFEAIQVARRTGIVLKIAAKLDRIWERFFSLFVEPHLRDGSVEYIGEVDEVQKARLLGGARALIFPISWEEPFGLVMAEAMACGTPVIAFPRGAVSEVVKDGETGFIVPSVDAMVAALQRIDQIDSAACRAHVERHFSSERLVADYQALYERILSS